MTDFEETARRRREDGRGPILEACPPQGKGAEATQRLIKEQGIRNTEIRTSKVGIWDVEPPRVGKITAEIMKI